MKITRAARRDSFTVLPNDALRDSRLSWRARGLLAYLLSLPDGWETDAGRLADQATVEGRKAVLTALRELETVGYLIRTRRQTAQGWWITDCEVVENPAGSVENGPTEVPSRNVGSPNVGPCDANPLLKTGKNPPTPTSGGACPTHKEQASPNCRGCETNPRARRRAARLAVLGEPCGGCGPGRLVEQGDGTVSRCPSCHPGARTA